MMGRDGALQLLALVQRGGVLRRARHRQSRHVAQRRQQLQRLGARGRRLHGRGGAGCGGGDEGKDHHKMFWFFVLHLHTG